MHDEWMNRLSEYLDGDLAANDARDLERHLEDCDVCRATLVELSDVVASARALEDTFPSTDLWPRIAAGMTASTTTQRARGNRYTFSGSQLAAAAMVLMTVTATAVWFATNGRNGANAGDALAASGTIIQTSGTTVTPVSDYQPVTADPVADEDVAALERALGENRAQLDPATIEVIERSLDAIDRAIADASAALETDPGNPYLSRQLDNTKQKKLDILHRATGTRRAGT